MQKNITYHALHDLIAEGHGLVAVQGLQLLIDLFLLPDVVLLAAAVVTYHGLIGEVIGAIHGLNTIHLGVQEGT
jgi:hypothetical protein